MSRSRRQIKEMVFDREAALQRFGGDDRLLKERVELFFLSCPQYMLEIQEAISQGNAKALERAAYRLDWMLSTFSAGAAFEAALKLEVMGRKGRMDEVACVFLALESEIESFKSVFANLRLV